MAQADAPTPDKPRKLKRRWFQFGLRTLLILTTVCAVLFAWLDWWSHKARQQREAAFVLQGKPAMVTWSWSRWAVYLPPKLREAIDINYWGTVTEINFRIAGVNHLEDADIEQLTRLPELTLIIVAEERQVSAEQRDRIKKALPNCRIDTKPALLFP